MSNVSKLNDYSNEISNSELVKKSQLGDRSAFEQLVLRHQELVFSLAYKLTGNRILQYESSFAEQVDDKSYGLLSFGVSNLFNWQGRNVVVFNLTVDNLLDEEYISTIGYPEPGRSVNFTLEYKI